MEKFARGSAVTAARFNVNKLQAVACIMSSAACSIGFIYWAIRAFG